FAIDRHPRNLVPERPSRPVQATTCSSTRCQREQCHPAKGVGHYLSPHWADVHRRLHKSGSNRVSLQPPPPLQAYPSRTCSARTSDRDYPCKSASSSNRRSTNFERQRETASRDRTLHPNSAT